MRPEVLPMMSLANSLITPRTDFLGTSHLKTCVMHFPELDQFSLPLCPLQQGLLSSLSIVSSNWLRMSLKALSGEPSHI